MIHIVNIDGCEVKIGDVLIYLGVRVKSYSRLKLIEDSGKPVKILAVADFCFLFPYTGVFLDSGKVRYFSPFELASIKTFNLDYWL